MCCLLTTLVLLGPRFAVALWWLFDPARFNLVYGTFIWPLLGLIFLPFTTLMWTLVWQPVAGISGFNWIWIAIAVVLDIASYTGGGYGNRNRIPGYNSTKPTNAA